MARMYGSVRGSRGSAHRLGGASMHTIAATWQGSVRVELYVVSTGKGKTLKQVDYASIELMPWNGSGTYAKIYNGPIGKADAKSMARAKLIEKHLRGVHTKPAPKRGK